jgi:Ca-activated chloride channel family protein
MLHAARESRLMFHLAWPWMLLLLPLPWLSRWLLPAAPLSGSGALFVPFTPALSEGGVATREGSAQHPLRWWGGLVCWLLLVLAAARPQWLGEPIELPETGRNLLLAVDVSGSMETADLDTSNATRLDVVKQVAGEFIQRREGDRVGLILFGTQAYLQTPLTFDRKTVQTLLAEAVIGIAGRETAIGDAIGMALKRLSHSEGETVLVLLTDGANTAGNVAPDKAAELAAQAGLRIHSIGVGGVPRAVRGLLGMQMINPAADLDENTLQNIAKTTGGQYFRATDRQALEAIYQRLDELEPVTQGSRVVRPTTELYVWPLGLAFGLSLGLALSAWRRGAAR